MRAATSEGGPVRRPLRHRAWAVSLLASLALGCAPSVPKARNIVVVSVCSIRADHMSLYGYRRATTPALAEFSRDAWVFRHAVTQWPKTVPAFSAIMTGRYGHSNGVMRVTPGSRLDDAQVTLAEVLRGQGFETAAFNSTGALHEGTNVFQQGFARVDDTFSLKMDAFADAAARAAAFIAAPHEKPFLAWVHFNNAHAPYRAPGAPSEIFVDDAFYDRSRPVRYNTGPSFSVPVPANHPHIRQILRADIGGARPGAQIGERAGELDYFVARYDAGILGADNTMKTVFDALAKSGRLEDTVVAVVGDHGESLGDHDYYFEHGRFPYDDCARVPLLIRPPRGVSRREIAEPVATFRLAPTLLEMAGVAAPPEMEATTLLPWLRGEEEFAPVFTESGYQMDYTLSVRDRRFKYIFVPNAFDRAIMRGKSEELYDLVADPGESVDVADRYPEEARRLASTLRRWSHPWIRTAYTTTLGVEVVDEEIRAELRALGYLN
jgi:arylsulfatase A-like enzyme